MELEIFCFQKRKSLTQNQKRFVKTGSSSQINVPLTQNVVRSGHKTCAQEDENEKLNLLASCNQVVKLELSSELNFGSKQS